MTDDIPLFASDIAERVRNFTWKPWHAHRVLTHQREPLAERITRLRAMHTKTHLGDDGFWDRLVSNFILEIFKDRDLPQTMLLAVIDLVGALVVDNRQYFTFPEIKNRSRTAEEAAYVTDLLDEVEIRIRHEERIRQFFLEGVGGLADRLVDILHRPSEPSPFLVPIHSRAEPAALVGHAIWMFTHELMPEADAPLSLAFFETRKRLVENLLAVSNLTWEQMTETPHRVVTPHASKLAPADMMRAYLEGTPLLPFFEMPVPFAIPREARFEHCHVIGGTGHGKTQLLQTSALSDFDDPARPAVVVIDSQGDMIKKLSRLARFADNDRLVIVDPSDTDFPLALNVFDIHKERLDAMTLGQREQILAGIIELYDYIFGAIGADLTQKQSVVFRYITRLMLDIPGANIQTLRQLMEDEKPFRPYIERLTGTTRAFFDNEFSDRSFVSTKQQIRRRLYGILSNPTFERLFSSDKNKLDMVGALDTGKIVLINTAKDVLKSEASSFFGRYMIALVMQAAFERAAVPEHARRAAFLYIDEAADYFDANIDTLLIQARKFKLGVTMAHQFLDQLTSGLRASVMANPTIRFAGGVSRKDANALDADMRTTGDFLMAMRKRADATEFACYVRNVTSAAVKLDIPLGRVEREPVMTDEQYLAVLERSRALVAQPLNLAQPASVPMGTTDSSKDDDPSTDSEW